MKWPVRTIAGTALALCGAAVWIMWLMWPAPGPKPGVSQPAEPSKEEKKAGPKVQVALKKPIKAIPPAVKKPLGLPATVQADPEQYVLATTSINAEARPYTASAVLDGRTGDTTIYVRPDPQPWIAFEDSGAVGIAVGLREDGARVGILHGRVDVLRIKDVHVGAIGMVDTTVRAFAGVNIEWRF